MSALRLLRLLSRLYLLGLLLELRRHRLWLKRRVLQRHHRLLERRDEFVHRRVVRLLLEFLDTLLQPLDHALLEGSRERRLTGHELALCLGHRFEVFSQARDCGLPVLECVHVRLLERPFQFLQGGGYLLALGRRLELLARLLGRSESVQRRRLRNVLRLLGLLLRDLLLRDLLLRDLALWGLLLWKLPLLGLLLWDLLLWNLTLWGLLLWNLPLLGLLWDLLLRDLLRNLLGCDLRLLRNLRLRDLLFLLRNLLGNELCLLWKLRLRDLLLLWKLRLRDLLLLWKLLRELRHRIHTILIRLLWRYLAHSR
ncbi:hypothetical protein [Halobaculum limi]|uniref:hypothetical protein n=1 Tax=Halobaculum limi TaxID=3031916 RepID=UPI0024056E58|nr:hypothetical protein [Halobaculum sp. YSMS11]